MLMSAAQFENAVSQYRAAARRLNDAAELLEAGSNLAQGDNSGVAALVEDAAQIEAITQLFDGGERLSAAILEVMVGGYVPAPA